jgi:glyoxylase-like metal-dependent hydrolase (beta-lactamase superfamily II)
MFKTANLLLSMVLALGIYGCGGKVDLDRTGLIKLTDHVYAFVAEGPEAEDGLGANSGFVVGEEAVLVVDSRYTPALASELLEAIRSVTDLPIAFVVNTHYHPDHTWGNSTFKEAGARILSCPETDAYIEKYSPAYLDHYRRRAPGIYQMLKDIRIVLPDSIVDSQITVDLGKVSVSIECVGAAHTAGDCIVSLPEGAVLFTGGLISNGYHPNLGDPGMNLGRWLSTLDRWEGEGFRYVVPGQGRVGASDLIGEQKGYIEKLREVCREAISGGMRLDRAVSELSLPGTERYEQQNLLAFNIRAIYRNEALEVVQPPFRLLMPQGYILSDGAGDSRSGLISWLRESGRGKYEIEVQWNPTARSEVIAQDLQDLLAEHLARSEGLDMEIDGSKRVWIEDIEAPALYGDWRFGGGLGSASGSWEWIMFKEGDLLYTVRLSVSGGRSNEENIGGIELLERLVTTIDLGSE